MNGKNHFTFSLYTAIILFLALWYYNNYSGIQIERCGFWFFSVVLYLNPDSDTPSKPSNNLGIFKYLFLPLKHRGISHNPFFWGCVGLVFGYLGFVPEAIGLFGSAMSHIVMDLISSLYKKLMPGWLEDGISLFYGKVKKVF